MFMCAINQPATYVVMTQDLVVLQDLSDTIAEFDPQADVFRAITLASAVDMIGSMERISVVFLEAGPGWITRAGVDAMVRARGGRLVLLGDDAEDESDAGGDETSRWTLLARPFSARTVCELIAASLGNGTPAAS
jgi:hypothetical protein